MKTALKLASLIIGFSSAVAIAQQQNDYATQNAKLQEQERQLLSEMSSGALVKTSADTQQPKVDKDTSAAVKSIGTDAKSSVASVKPAPAPVGNLEETVGKKLAALEKTNRGLSDKLRISESSKKKLEQETEELRSRLIIAETEVQRLSSKLEQRNRASLADLAGASKPAINDRAQIKAAPARVNPATESDMLIATVMADKAFLRAGPGADNSPLMAVAKGTRLTVETREGSWYRVNTPTGTRAWISADMVAFGPSARAAPGGTLRIKGYDASAEDEAVKLLKNLRP